MISSVLPTYARAPLEFELGEGVWLIDKNGERYLDLGAGIAVAALGHANPVLVKALTDQAQKLWHTSNLYEIANQKKLAELLVENTFADTVFFTNSGTEATECAVKMARKYFSHVGQPDRIEIITFAGAFHGRSSAGIAASGGEKMVKGFGPLLPGFVKVPFGDHDGLRATISAQTAAVLIEPIQGEGGIRVVPEQCLKGLRDLCNQHGILLIFDEIQCGMGRTGKLFHHEWAGVEPDIMTVAKGIGGGFPLGACLATEKAASGMVVGTHGSTYGGNPLACAVGIAVLQTVLEPGFLADVCRVARYLRKGLERLVASYPAVFEGVRGDGLMLGLRCKVAPIDVVEAGYSEHILVIAAADNVVRIMPALNITNDEIDEAMRRLDKAASRVNAGVKP